MDEIFGEGWQCTNEQMIKFQWKSGSQIWTWMRIATLVRRSLADLYTVPVLLALKCFFSHWTVIMHVQLIIIIQWQCLWCCPQSWPWLLREFTRFIWWMQTERRVAANPQTKPTDLDCESADKRLLPSTSYITILLLLLSPEADTHFTVLRRVEGWVNRGTAGRVSSRCPRLYIGVAVVINITGGGLSHHSQSCHR